jgi:phage shock protein C
VTERLYRHPTDRVIAGVAGGLATWLNLDPSLVRIAWVLLTIFTGGALILVYIVMMIVVPLPPAGWIPRPRDSWGAGPGSGWSGGGGWNSGGWNSGGWTPSGTGWAPGGGPGDPPSTDPSAAGWTAPDGSAASAGAQAPGTPPAGGWASSQQPWMSQPQQPYAPSRPGNGGLIAGVILVGLGVWFLVDQYVRIDWDLAWPVLIMLAGGALIGGAVMRGRHT